MIFQLLVMAGVVVYGIWSAKKTADKKRQTTSDGGGAVRHLSENFPFPASTSGRAEVGHSNEDPDRIADELDVEEGAIRSSGATNGMNSGRYVAAVATIAAVEEADEIADANGIQHSEEITDLRTMIISSELLKPKYLEY